MADGPSKPLPGEGGGVSTVIECPSACTVTLAHEFSLPVLNLSPAEAAQISSAILLVWGAGWCFRALVQALRNTDGNQPTED